MDDYCYEYEYKNPFEIVRYCEDHKINIDLGSFITHTACLLNLDTWEVTYFRDKTLNESDWKRIRKQFGNE